MLPVDDVIYAPASGQGGAISVVRISGAGCLGLLDSVVRLRHGAVASTPGFALRFGEIPGLDEVLVSVFRAPHSYTGEDSAELSCHASPYILSSLMERFSQAGARLAEPGEFTRRAFLNGKMDLAQAEAVADVISSVSSAQHRASFNQLRGGYSEELTALRSSLLKITTLLELELDFSEEDVEFADRAELRSLLVASSEHCARLADSFRLGNAVRSGVPVAIVGPPNSGKSTLLNALVKDDRAIVSDIPGTTRDTVEETCVIDGVLFRFIDTAGIRESSDEIERLGIERTYRKLSGADVVLGLVDLSVTDSREAFMAAARELASLVDLEAQKLLILGSKADLGGCNKNVIAENNSVLRIDIEGVSVECLLISAKSGLGLENLCRSLVSSSGIASGTGTLVTNARHAEALRQTVSALSAVLSGLDRNMPGDLLAEDLRQALRSLGSITGEFTTDEILSEIFKGFCIGK